MVKWKEIRYNNEYEDVLKKGKQTAVPGFFGKKRNRPFLDRLPPGSKHGRITRNTPKKFSLSKYVLDKQKIKG